MTVSQDHAHTASDLQVATSATLEPPHHELIGFVRDVQRWLMLDAEPSHVGSDDMRVYHLDGGVLSNLLNRARDLVAKAEGK